MAKKQLGSRVVTWTPDGANASGEPWDPITFTLAPRDFVRFVEFTEKAREIGPRTGATLALTADQVADAILDWEGLEREGRPAPCTPENKREFLRSTPQAFNFLVEDIAGLAGERKNGSGGGSSSSSPTPASTAESTTPAPTSTTGHASSAGAATTGPA